MINLTILFKNHFDSSKISDDKLKVFSEDHIQRINVNNGSGLFTAIMNDTVAAHTAYFGNITGEATNKAIQKWRHRNEPGIDSKRLRCTGRNASYPEKHHLIETMNVTIFFCIFVLNS